MNYESALAYILSFTDHERNASQPQTVPRFDVRRVEAFLESIGSPHLAFPTVHIAGTRGKGSTAAMTASVLTAAGLRTGLFTSPHLLDFRERIRIGSVLIQPGELASLVERLRPRIEEFQEAASDRLTTFELITSLAFRYFFEQRVDIVVLETGLGGRLDATNVARPLVAALTSISLDHTNILGKTIRSIAIEKSGIIKPGAVVVTAPQAPEAADVIASISADRGRASCELALRSAIGGPFPSGFRRIITRRIGQHVEIDGRRCYRLWLPLLGEHQAENAAVAVGMIEALEERGITVGPEAVDRGLAEVTWPGRLQLLRRRPLVVADGAQNGYSARRLIQALRDHFTFRDLILIIGVTWPVMGRPIDKNVASIAEELGPVASAVIASGFDHPRAIDPELLAPAFSSRHQVVQIARSARDAIARALAQAAPNDLICITGSLFLVADALKAYELTPVVEG